MADDTRNITLTFEDGSTHQYQNVPKSVTPDQVEQRASKEFTGKKLKGISGDASPITPTPASKKESLPSMFGTMPEPTEEAKGYGQALSSAGRGLAKFAVPLVTLGGASGEETGQALSRAGIPEAKDKTGRAIEATAEYVPMAAGFVPALKELASLPAKGYTAAKSYAQKAMGAEPKALSEALKTNLSGRVGEVIQQAEKSAIEPSKKLESVSKAQKKLGGREPVASARQTERDKKVQESLNSLGKAGVLEEDVGSIIQPAGRQNVKGLVAQRQTEAITKIKDPAFDRARNRQSSGEFIATNPKSKLLLDEAMVELETQINRTTEPYRSQLKQRLESLRGKEVPFSEAEQRVENLRASIAGRQPKTTKTEPITLDQAEFMRRMLTDKNLAESSGFAALDVGRRTDVAKKISAAMIEFEPGVGQYLEKYREMSGPIEKATAGRGGKLTEADTLAEEEVLFGADKKAAANYYLDGSQEKAERLINLVGGKQPQLVNAIKGNLRTRMENMNAKQAEKFISDNEGLLRVFPEFRDPMKKVAEAKRVAETLGVKAAEKAKSAATRLAGESTEARTAKESAEKISNDYRILENQLRESTAKESITKANEIANKMRKDGLVNDAQHRELLQNIRMIKDAYGDSEKARQAVNSLIKKSLGYGLLGTAGVYGVKQLGE